MKKLVFVALLNLMVIELLLYLGMLSGNQALETFREENKSSSTYVLSFEQTTCTSRDFEQYMIPNILVLKVYPKIKLAIEDEAITKQLEVFSYQSVEKLEQDYMQILKKYGLDDDILKISHYGVSIQKAIVRASSEEMSLLKTKFPNLSYQASMIKNDFFSLEM